MTSSHNQSSFLVGDEPGKAVQLLQQILDRTAKEDEQAAPVYFYLSAALAMNDEFDASLAVQEVAIQHWNEEIEKRFSLEDRNRPITDVSLRRSHA